MNRIPLFWSALVTLFFLIVAGYWSISVTYTQTRLPRSASSSQAANEQTQAKDASSVFVPSKTDPTSRPGAITIGSFQVVIPDISVVDQNGKRWRLYSDLIKDKVVVLSFFLTNCLEVCPMQGRSLAKLQSHLGKRAGKDVFFLSISMDPARDSPKQLKAWADTYKAKPGWTLVTGDEEQFRKLVHDFIGESLGGGSHLPVLLIGDDRTGRWAEAMSESRPEDLIRVINSLSQPAKP